MIKFFRQIRQNLLMENKTGKYLKYAIGEIVLVVIGILIALSINNWNEQQKINVQELIILKELKLSLESNKTILNTRVINSQDKILRGKLLQEHLKEKRPYHDSLRNFFRIPTFALSAGLSYASFDNTKNQGLQLIKNNELRLELIRLFDEEFKAVTELGINSSRLLTNTIAPFIQKHFEYTTSGLVPNDYIALLNAKEYANILSRSIYLNNLASNLSSDVLLKTDVLVEALDKEIRHLEKR